VIRTAARLAAVAAVSVIMLVVVPGTAPATAPSTSIQILSAAHLVEPGGHVIVTIYYSCGPATLAAGSLNVSVTEPGKSGSSFQQATCDDQKHRLEANVGPGPFEAGSASASVSVTNTGLSTQNAQAEITIR
jgi:hypothetical protein